MKIDHLCHLAILYFSCWRDLVEESVQHADTEHLPCGEGQAEHEHQVGPLLPFLL